LYYHQNYLLPGLAISLVSIGLFLVAVAKRGRCKAQRSDHPDAIHPVAAPRASERGRRGAPAEPPRSYATALSRFRPLARALAAVVGLVLIWLVAIAETQQVRRFLTLRSQMESRAHSRMGGALALQRQIPQASAHYLEALRLAECACRLTGYREPKQLETLAWVYGDVGDFDRAAATAKEARDFALASGQDEQADQLLKFILACDTRKSASGK
jgi:tetratricopeptide (TPR) repeat protein